MTEQDIRTTPGGEKTTTPPSNRRRDRERREARTGWIFMTPFLAAFILVFLIPIVVSIYSSFFREYSTGGGLYGGGNADHFVGLENYYFVVTSSSFWLGMARVIGYTVIQVPIMIISALALALVLDSYLTRHVTIYRLGYFLPFAIPGVVAAIIWIALYTPDISPIADPLNSFGTNVLLFLRFIGSYIGLDIPLIDVDLLKEPAVLGSMANMTTWTYTGYNMLIFLAALQAIPSDLSEAARIDGASGFQIVTRIKIPMVRGAALLAVLLSIIGTIQLFTEPEIIEQVTKSLGKTYTPMMMVRNTMDGSITPGGDGPATAVSVVMAIIAGTLAALYALVDRKLEK